MRREAVTVNKCTDCGCDLFRPNAKRCPSCADVKSRANNAAYYHRKAARRKSSVHGAPGNA